MPVSDATIADAAQAYLSAGLCALPATRAEKRPAVGRWKQYQDRMPNQAEVSAWLANNPDAVCVLCGAVSGNLETIDFDAGGELFDAWWQKIPEALQSRLVIEATQNDGRHVCYCCVSSVSGNLKLAQRKDDGKKAVTLIETRGEGGLIICSPTAGYEMVQGDFCNLPVLTEAQRDVLLQAAWELNEYVPPVVDGASASKAKYEGSVNHDNLSAEIPQIAGTPHHSDLCAEIPQIDGRPGDDFNNRGDVRSLLQQCGWSRVRGGENEYWRRPGKTSGWSATLKERVFYVFSANAEPFEANRAYSPFSVYALLNYGGDFEQAARSLREKGFGSDSLIHVPTGADISGIVGMSAPESDCPSDHADNDSSLPQILDPGPMSAEMLRMPGFVNEVMDHCLATAPYPNPVMAFCGALSLLSFLTGRKVRDSGDNRSNLYLLGLAHSAAGKDWPRKINTRIVHEVGLSNCLGERFASGEGIQDALFQTPCMLFQTDEIDGLLQSINKSKDGRHEALMSTLLTMFSVANSVFPMRRRAGKEPGGVIDQPSLTIFGTAIPNHYYEALSERMLTNGFFARMIILEAGARAAGQEPSIRDLPPRVLAAAKWWAEFQPGSGNLQQWHPVPVVVEHTDEARKLLVETRQQAEAEYAKAEAGCDAVGTTVWGRVSEQIRKLSLLYAVSSNHQSPRIDLAAIQWASDFVMHQTRRMLFMAASHVADGEFDALIKRTVTILRQWHEKHGNNALMQGWELRRRLKQRPGDFKDIISELIERRIATFETETTKTKPKSGYRLL